MPRPAQDFTGARKGRLQIIERVGLRGNAPLWSVRCDCGRETEMTSTQLQGSTVSCGCYRDELLKKRLTKHGKSPKGKRTRIYGSWVSMRTRCEKSSAINYSRYGGRGIKVCDRWQEFQNFYDDMGDPPTEQHTIDRIDNDKGYEPGNCRWATCQEQAVNQRPSENKGHRAKDLSGERFGRLTAIERAGSKNGYVLWRTRCDCGNESETPSRLLISGKTQSCGCLRSETTRAHIKAVNAR